MKLSDIITPEKFRQLAAYITKVDEILGQTESGTEVQDDLYCRITLNMAVNCR